MTNVFGRLALVALLIFAAVAFWYWRVEKKLEEKIPIEKKPVAALPAQKTDEAAAPVKADYSVIVTRNIFKAVLEQGEKPAGAQAQSDLDNLAETKMQLVLLGTVTGSKEDARAIIRDEKAKLENIYRIGGELHGATITRIGRGKVVLQVNGREEVLTIKDPGAGGQRPVASPVAEGLPPGQAEGQRTTPVVMPQRRISFRNTPPTTPAAAAPEPEDIPVEEAPPPDSPEEDNTDPNAQ